jgi:hypothetical protein
MDLDKISEVNIEDVFADVILELDEIDSTIKIICCALENSKYSDSDIENIDNILFMLQGKINTIKNNLGKMKKFNLKD